MSTAAPQAPHEPAIPRYVYPVIVTALVGVYLVSLREVHFVQSVQMTAGWLCVALLLALRFTPGGRQAPLRLVFVLVAAYLTIRYMWWRTLETLIYTTAIDFIGMALLYTAELYSIVVLLLGLFVNLWPLKRAPVELPADRSQWPTVDIFIPTYNEDVEIVRVTAAAALQIDYPPEKRRIWILDDGGTLAKRRHPTHGAAAWERRYALQLVAAELGVEYLTRESNKHAKAGNLNHGMAHARGDLILFLDCDHVPTTDILQRTAGYFLADPKLFLVQTPHFFVNPAPTERSLGRDHSLSDESEMFYRSIQLGLDAWNASYFCGSAAVMRRSCLDEIGGIRGLSITEDCETAFELHRRGYNSAYVSRPMICGLSPESYDDYMVQHTRWAQGMVQIFMIHNPVLSRGLTLAQRLCYLNCCLFWFFGIARIIYFAAPAAFLLFGLSIYHASAGQVMAYAMPYVASTLIIMDFFYGSTRRPFFSEVYESIQSVFLAPAAISAILHPHAPSFKVTPKGTTQDKEQLNRLAIVFFFVVLVNLLACAAGLVRFWAQPDFRDVIALTLAWAMYNCYLATVSLGALWERRQVRSAHRYQATGHVVVQFPHLAERATVALRDLSLNGIGFVIDRAQALDIQINDRIEVEGIGPGGVARRFGARLQRVSRRGELTYCGAEFVLSEERFPEIVHFVYGDSARWMAVWELRSRGGSLARMFWRLWVMGLRGAWMCAKTVPEMVRSAWRAATGPWLARRALRREQRVARQEQAVREENLRRGGELSWRERTRKPAPVAPVAVP